MVVSNRNAFCRDAEPHYYDYLLNPDNETIPRRIADHIGRCAHCREQIRDLEQVLAGPGASEAQASCAVRHVSSSTPGGVPGPAGGVVMPCSDRQCA